MFYHVFHLFIENIRPFWPYVLKMKHEIKWNYFEINQINNSTASMRVKLINFWKQ